MSLCELDDLRVYHPDGSYKVKTITSDEQHVGNKIDEGVLQKSDFYKECYKSLKARTALLRSRLAEAEAEARILKGVPLPGDGDLAGDDEVKSLYTSAMARVRERWSK